ncbi:MAG: oxygenase MpaB family protein [Actinomycetes bacterium]
MPEPAGPSRRVATAPIAVIDAAREHLGLAARRLLTAGDGAYPEFPFADHDDPGLFGPDSMTWRVHAHRSMLVGGLRALFVQMLHPLAMAGVAEHSSYRTDPLGRLARTGRFVATTTFGTTDAAEQAIAGVRAVHGRVRGIALDGRRYDATDPALLSWVHNVEVESFLTAYRTYGPGTSEAEADRYVREMRVLGFALGADDLPVSAAGLREWVQGHREIAASPAAHAAVRFLLLPPLPIATRPAYAVIAAASIELLSLRQRLLLRLPSLPGVETLTVRPPTAGLLGLLGWALGPPPPLAARAAG